jgi:hypothetical protein
MLTGRDTLFFCSAFFVAPKAQGMVSSPQMDFPAALSRPFLSHIFSWLEATQERRGSRVKSARLLRVHREQSGDS